MPATIPNAACGELRVVVVGCGALTELFYAPALTCLRASHALTVTALIDPDPARVAAIGKGFPQARRGAGLEDIAEADLAIVASPAAFHAGQTVALLERGFHVLCEKPMARSLAECDAMIAAARQAGRLLAVGHFKRFFPAVRQIKDLIDTGAFGRPLSFDFAEGGKFGWPARSRSFFERRSGGVLADIGVHALDLALFWYGQPERLTCEDDAMGGVDANARVQLSYPNGLNGRVAVSRDWNMPNRFVLRFERGWIAWDPVDANGLELGWGDSYALKGTTHEAGRMFAQPAAGAPAATRHQAFMNQIVNVADAIRGHARLAVSGEEGRKVMALLEICHTESTLIDMPWMGAAERAAAEALRC